MSRYPNYGNVVRQQRVGFIVAGVVRQAVLDAGVQHLKVFRHHPHQAQLIEEWCGIESSDELPALTVSAANKTELLLQGGQRADLFPLGDLYATDIALLSGQYDLSPEAEAVVAESGGIEIVDEMLRGLIEERRSPGEVFAARPQLQQSFMQLLERNRFHRMRIGVVPKIGARTLGIDLFI